MCIIFNKISNTICKIQTKAEVSVGNTESNNPILFEILQKSGSFTGELEKMRLSTFKMSLQNL